MPEPLPAPDVILIQLAVVVAVQAQPELDVTPKVLDPPFQSSVSDDGETETVTDPDWKLPMIP